LSLLAKYGRAEFPPPEKTATRSGVEKIGLSREDILEVRKLLEPYLDPIADILSGKGKVESDG
jgi:hypothetical protein